MDEITKLIEKVGEVRVLEELVAYFDYLAQDGLIRAAEEKAHIETLLDQLRERVRLAFPLRADALTSRGRAAGLVSTSRCIVQAVDTQKERSEAERARFDLACGDMRQGVAYAVAAVALNEPAPLRERAVIERLHDDRLLVPHRIDTGEVV